MTLCIRTLACIRIRVGVSPQQLDSWMFIMFNITKYHRHLLSLSLSLSLSVCLSQLLNINGSFYHLNWGVNLSPAEKLLRRRLLQFCPPYFQENNLYIYILDIFLFWYFYIYFEKYNLELRNPSPQSHWRENPIWREEGREVRIHQITQNWKIVINKIKMINDIV